MNGNLTCQSCGNDSFHIEPHEKNGYKATCSGCGAFLRWLGKDQQARRSAVPIRKTEPPFCIFCGIGLDEAKIGNMGFEIDHILPLAYGGKDEPENVGDMCAACHAEKTARMLRVTAMKKIISAMRVENGRPGNG